MAVQTQDGEDRRKGRGMFRDFRHIRTWMSKCPAAQMLRPVLDIGLNFAPWRKDVMDVVKGHKAHASVSR